MSLRLIAALAAAAIAVAACGGGTEDGPGEDAPAGTADDPSTENALEVTMQEYAFSVEGEAQAGPLLVSFTNAGEQLHHGIVGKLDEGKTLDDVQAFLEKGAQGPPPPWFDDAPIDETIVSPGETSGIVLDAEEGTYVLLCFLPDPKGRPHIEHGMVQTFDIAAGDAEPIEPDVNVSMTEDGIAEAPELSAGTSVVEVTNDAEIPGEVFVTQLAEGQTLDDVEPWFQQGQKGEAPATFFGGTHQFGPGESVALAFTLEPGDYQIVATYGEGRDIKDLPTDFTVTE